MRHIPQLLRRNASNVAQIMAMANSRRSNAKLFVAPFVLLLLQFAICPQRAAAQTNTFPQSGNAGIGTTSPPNPLTITRSGSTPYTSRPAFELLQLIDRTDNTPQILFGSAHNGMFLRYTGTETVTSQRVGIFTGGLVEAFVVHNDGNVGIGTTAPKTKLHVDNSGIANFTGSTAGAFSVSGNGVNYFVPIDFRNTDSASYPHPVARIAMQFTNAGSNLLFGTSNSYGSGVTNTAMAIDYSGNVGIGTTTPSASYKLDVNGGINASGNINATGNITASGNIAAKYQDLAEWVPASHALPAGTVVTLDTTKSNHVEASSKAYDTRVAGVISAQPGIALGERGENKVLVATTGRVKVKVDASAGAIQVGDLLVSSDIEGVAIKSKPIDIVGVQIHRPGTIIGKALEPLAKGRGEILVLLSLQ